MSNKTMRTGQADLPLHGGRAPKWLFGRMTQLAREMTLAIVDEHGVEGMLARVSDPFWFQAFGCVLGFDWHSSGLTTTTCGALKEGLRDVSDDIGLVVAGGKGKTSRRAPFEIEAGCEKAGLDPAPLVRASRLSAKVDSAAVQDGYQVYQHTFLFSKEGSWAVVQQGMNESNGMARRYHWLTAPAFDSDPHAGVAGRPEQLVLNLVAGEAAGNRSVATELAREQPGKIVAEIERLREAADGPRKLALPRRHAALLSDVHPNRLERVLTKSYESQPGDFTELLAVPGVGAKGLRALALVAELVYGEPSSVKDPVSFSYAHGGKDGTPYPVNRRVYDSTIDSLRDVVSSRIGRTDKSTALRRLARLETA